MNTASKTRTRDMTTGPILSQVILFSLPLMVGNLFQMLYNTVDSVVVGRFVSTEALAAVGSTAMIVNIMVFFFNGFSVGAGVVIARHFGARDMKKLHTAVETTMALTFVICVLFTIIGLVWVRPMLRLMATPEDVMTDAAVYLRIYFAGISGLLVYNIGSGILRAVGDSTRPLMFLALTSILNIILDLVFVIVFHGGIAGVAYATILSQFISAGLTLLLLTRSRDIYRLVWRDLHIDPAVTRQIFSVGMPAGIQSVITSISNVFVQSYVNYFGSACMAGWSCYNKLDQFMMLPMQSMSMASTTFVGQNMGAGNEERANRGTFITVAFTEAVMVFVAIALFVLAAPATALFTQDQSVIDYGVLFLRANVFFILFNCVNHVLAGGLRGRGNARGPMVIMLSCFVVLRQIYLFIMTRFVANTPFVVGFGYPVGWVSCCIIEIAYFRIRWGKKKTASASTQG